LGDRIGKTIAGLQKAFAEMTKLRMINQTGELSEYYTSYENLMDDRLMIKRNKRRKERNRLRKLKGFSKRLFDAIAQD